MAAKIKTVKITLGCKAKDKITGFMGTVTARCEFISGLVRFEVTGLTKDGAPVQDWQDEDRLVVVTK
jgi:RNA 3'-terminal phosphate cyclase